jgi:Holliday junction DNA helicase RuvA
MIGRLLGHCVAESPDGSLIIDVNGVGYDVLAPMGTLGRARTESDGRVAIFVHTLFRQDSLDLFGFASEHERRVFRMVVAVPNVGPKTAIALLGTMPPPELATTVRDGDLARLGKVPGIGKKIAERILLELKGKVAEIQPPGEALPISDQAQVAGPEAASRVVLALTSMGFKQAEAQAAVRSLGEVGPEKSVSVLIRDALARLSR